MKRPTIKDVASQAGVSTTTISRFLNGKYDSMSEGTRNRIEQIINESGYRPSNIARSLKSKHSRLIGVIISDISNPFFSTLLDTINQKALRAGYSLLISISNNSAASELSLIKKYIDNGVDGLLINTVGCNNEIIEQISQSVPVVLLDRDIDTLRLPVVTSNNYELMEKILIHLKDECFDQAVLLTEDLSTSSIRRLRADAFQSVCQNLRFKGQIFEVEHKNEKQIENLICSLISPDSITAFITTNTLVLQALLDTIAKRNWKIGADLGVVSFDDFPWSSFIGISSVWQDSSKIGTEAFKLLTRAISSGKPPLYKASSRRKIIPGAFLIRKSSINQKSSPHKNGPAV